nr:hypothetical protein [Tanacetum cinerariifolium]
MFNIKIHRNVEFLKPPDKWYKFALSDYVNLVDFDMFSLYELSGMLKKCKRIKVVKWPAMGKEDEHVDTLNHDSTPNVCPVVEHTNDGNVGHLYCDNEVPMGNPFRFINPLKGSDVEIHNVENKHVGDIHEKVHETLMDDDLFQQDSIVNCQQDSYHVIDEEQKIKKILAELNHPGKEVIFQTSDAQVLMKKLLKMNQMLMKKKKV